ncbi:MAG TPA: PQQ-binding-like beta-propeller repeat protein [Steroidobacteraceae bacterium]|jgi:PQQ-dependent dehydrogenase (methanol/ethanol family)|nr:PQQ-binding-like beta-propeller repeat protein [Steroidobacteraceae bacterium]
MSLQSFACSLSASLALAFGATAEAAQLGEVRPVTDAMLAAPAGASWLGYRGNLANWGFSSLDQVDASNVARLTLAWSWPLDPGINETTPLAHDGVLYVVNPGGAIQALDGRSGDMIWEYRRKLPADIVGGIGAPIRSLALYEDSLYSVTVDGYLIALDAKTGILRWQQQTGDYRTIMQSTGPLVARGKVFTGRSCTAVVAGSCYILANDARTGKELWRRYVVPRPGEPGDETWGGLPLDQRRHVGAWGPGSYDPELNLLYWGTSIPAPSNEHVRGTPGASMLYTNSTLALDPDTGRIVWYFQHLPRDNWDLDHVSERILVDSEVRPDGQAVWKANPRASAGGRLPLLTGIPGKTGIVWTLDRRTGEFLWARETVRQNVIRDIDAKTGKVTVNEDAIPDTAEAGSGLVCPSNKGGKVWQVGSYSPRTRAMYMPLQNMCMEPQSTGANPTAADGYGLLFNIDPAPGANALGTLQAISVETGRTLWKYEQRAGMFSVLATAGDVVFAGDADRRFRAHDAATGQVLWETVLQGPVTGTPIAFEVDGRQYIAVAAGGGDWLSVAYNAAVGLPTVNVNNMLYVFALPGSSPARDQRLPAARAVAAEPGRAPHYTPSQADRGATVYAEKCLMCHGPEMKGTFVGPALRGAFFMRRWGNRPLGDLFSFIHKSMPMQAPGSLDGNAVDEILAYWARLNGYAATDVELDHKSAEMGVMRIQPRE